MQSIHHNQLCFQLFIEQSGELALTVPPDAGSEQLLQRQPAPQEDCTIPHGMRCPDWRGMPRFAGMWLLLGIFVLCAVPSFAQSSMKLLDAGTPGIADSGAQPPVVLGVKMFSDVPGKVLGCSFYKAPENAGPHVVSLWDSAGKILASQTTTTETASGKQTLLFSAPVTVSAKQTFICGYYTSTGHFSYDRNIFTVQKDIAPLHIPINGGVSAYPAQTTSYPTLVWMATNYWVDVVFSPSSISTTFISGTSASMAGSTASVIWSTAVPSDSQVEYGSSSAYGTSTTLAPALTTAHTVALSGLSAGTLYHFRVHSSDADKVSAVGSDQTMAPPVATLPVSISASPLSATITSGATQQFTALVSNSSNRTVTWSATAGTISAAGLFTAPQVSVQTSILVKASSQADPTKTASATLTVNAAAAAFTVSPASLTFAGETSTSSLTPASLNISNGGTGALTFTGTSDQSWLKLSAASGTTPATLQVGPAMSGLKAGNYTGHVSLSGGGTTKIVTVTLQVTSPAVQHSVVLSWKASTSTQVVSYSVYRSSVSGSSYALMASAIGGGTYADESVLAGSSYYYVLTAVDSDGQESKYSGQVAAIVP